MKKVAVIGSGISGLSVAKMLSAKAEVTVFERESAIGGLVKCDRPNDILFHRVGGHVFNSKNQEVLDWFWGQFDKEKEFLKATRNARILIHDKIVGYPIENFLYQLPANIVDGIITDMLAIQGAAYKKPEEYPHFEAFLKGNFGESLYNLYFGPYNTKIWNLDLSTVPLEWLDGKLPMPNLKQMLMANIVREEEREMVHASFFYPKENGSQFIVDRLAEGLNILVNSPLTKLEKTAAGKLKINDDQEFDDVVFTGDIRALGSFYTNATEEQKALLKSLENLRSNGTSNLLCECDATDVSWLYLPEAQFKAHRIIYTGNFAESNNRGSNRTTCTVEFSGKHSVEEMVAEIAKLPGNLSMVSYNYEPNSYVVQDVDTRANIAALKALSEADGLYLLGRFGEWEYYNMDKAIEAAMLISADILKG